MHKQSLIIHSNTNQEPLVSFITWLNNETNSSFDINTIVNQANISVINTMGESIKIETVRTIKEQLSFGTYQVNQTRFVVLLHAHLITTPAQNALLKTIEEPPINTQIILVTPTPQKLLSTIRSRCQIISLKNSIDDANKTNVGEIKQLYSNIKMSNHGQKITLASTYKEREDALLVCNQLLSWFHNELRNKKSTILMSDKTHNSNILLNTIECLEHNCNVLLTMENCFFKLI